MHAHMLMRDAEGRKKEVSKVVQTTKQYSTHEMQKEGRKKQARSYKQQSNTAHMQTFFGQRLKHSARLRKFPFKFCRDIRKEKTLSNFRETH